jgi:hypothetical protein
LIRKLRFEFLF